MFNTSDRSARVVDVANVAALFAFCLSPVPAAAESYSPNVDAAYPDDAYRFAKGEVVQSTGGEPVRLRHPLDFLMVADHAENLGVLPRLAANPASLPGTENARTSAQMVADLPPLPDILNAETSEAFNSIGSALGAGKAAW